MLLKLLNKNNECIEVAVTTVWQDIHAGMNMLYFERPTDEIGKGTFVDVDTLNTWQIVRKQ